MQKTKSLPEIGVKMKQLTCRGNHLNDYYPMVRRPKIIIYRLSFILVGIIWISQKAPNEGFIYDFVIFEQYQGQGYGKKAMKEAEIIAKQLGMNKIGLNVFGHNKIARGLYEKMGYEITNITMAKTI